MRSVSVAIGAIAAFAFAGASQAAVTYTLSPVSNTSCCDPATIDVAGTITTDGATGVLSGSDILGWDITLTDVGHGSETISSATDPKGLYVQGSYLTATSTGLYWNYAQGTGAEFSITPPSEPGAQWHLFTNRSDVSFNGIEYANYQSGNALIGLAAVPEPSVWAMMLVGLLGLGAALRARRNGVLAPA